VVTGNYLGSVDFGGTTYPNAGVEHDIFLAKYAAADGAETWFKHIGVRKSTSGRACGRPPLRRRVECGWCLYERLHVSWEYVRQRRHHGQFNEYPAAPIDFGGGPVSSTNNDVFVAKYTMATGAYVWARHATGPGWENATGVAVDSAGNVVVTGNFDQTIDFGGGALNSADQGISSS